MRWTPRSTVACVIERDGRFLCVDEWSSGQRVINQPAGHVEEGETLIEAACRETLEETGWRVRVTGLLGLYVYHAPANGATYHRHCFIAEALEHDSHRPLDDGIIQALWLSRDELQQRQEQLRSSMVLTCIDDFLAGRCFPLDYIRQGAV